jgi:hypothetical protein
MRTLRPPRAYCTYCQATYRSGRGLMHRALGKSFPCPGIVRLVPNPNYWRICVWCFATGRHAAQTCPQCRGDGWLLAGSPEAMRGIATYYSNALFR